jgi:hypothetical protein
LILEFLMYLVTQISGIWLVLLEHSTLNPLFKLECFKKKSQWLALLAADLSLAEDKIVTLYGKRWDGCLLQDDKILLETYSGIPGSLP